MQITIFKWPSLFCSSKNQITRRLPSSPIIKKTFNFKLFGTPGVFLKKLLFFQAAPALAPDFFFEAAPAPAPGIFFQTAPALNYWLSLAKYSFPCKIVK